MQSKKSEYNSNMSSDDYPRPNTRHLHMMNEKKTYMTY